MSSAITYCSDCASADQIAALLQRCDAGFIPALSSRVDLAAYARKIAAHALRLEAWQGTEPVALLAMYCNDLDSGTAYITSVSVAPGLARRGIASTLLAQCIARAGETGMRSIVLEVDADNHAALRLYQKLGFHADTTAAPTIRMRLPLPFSCDNDTP